MITNKVREMERPIIEKTLAKRGALGLSTKPRSLLRVRNAFFAQGWLR